MKIHELKRKTKNKKFPLIGRGGKRGKTSGRGGKGQTARAGHKARPEMRDTIKRMPKLRGHGKNSNLSYQKKPFVVNVGDLEKIFAAGAKITPQTLVKKNVVKMEAGKNPTIKILALGDITKKFIVEQCAVSAEAKAKIEKAGGKVL
jgi:large subunit ribosomal protein L15